MKSLRAVFGEVYPDPVRVVSVGPVPHSIDELLAAPDREDWMRLSVEFCGGTHMDNTGEADTFTIVSEEGTAKGVRRITAYTREAAKAAQDAAAEFEKRVEAAAGLTDVAALDQEISAMRMDVDAVVMDYVRKDGIKKRIDALKDRVLAAEKETVRIKTEAALKWVEGLALGAETRHLVEVVDVDGDTKAVDAAMKALGARATELPILLLSRSAGGDRVSCLAVVPASRAAQADAREWVNAALEHCGGKGGGKADRAQGAAKDASGFDKAVAAARAFAAGKLA